MRRDFSLTRNDGAARLRGRLPLGHGAPVVAAGAAVGGGCAPALIGRPRES